MLARFAALAAAASVAATGAPPTPNDPAWPLEWGVRTTQAPAVWARSTGSPRVVIAVVDSGVTPIPELRGALLPGRDFVGDGTSTDDTYGHGTWVASIIAARGDNGRGMAGYCWRCSILPVRVTSGGGPVDASVVARGIVWAVDQGAQIVNVSLDGPGDDPTERAAVAYAASKGAVVVASAGNTSDGTREYPAAYPSVLAVAGTTPDDQLYPWSNRAPWIELAAPGCSTLFDQWVGVAYGCGTSFSPPAVSGILGLLLSADPAATPAAAAAALVSTARPVAGIGGGRVDAAAALAALGGAAGAPPPAAAGAGRTVSTFDGVLRGARSFSFRTSAGAVAVEFASAASRRCTAALHVGASVVAAVVADHGVLTLEARVAAGPHRVDVACRGRAPVRYQLVVEAPSSG